MSIEEKTTGRRFSRQKQIKYSGPDIHKGIADFTASYKSFHEQIAEMAEQAAMFLQSRGLPSAPRIVRVKGCARWHDAREADISNAPCVEGFSLEAYILTRAGYAKDSTEHLAAQIIVEASRLHDPNPETAQRAAFRLGQLAILSRVYWSEFAGVRNAREKRAGQGFSKADSDWHEDARKIADLYINEKPARSNNESAVADHVSKELKKDTPDFSRSIRQIKRVIFPKPEK